MLKLIIMMKYEFYKDLRWELYAKKMWEFTDAVKKSIWNDKLEDTVIASYLSKETLADGSPVKFGWQLDAEPYIKSFEEIQREHTFDYLSTYYIQLKFAYDYWKQYEAEWNKKYKKYIEYERSKTT